jgi:hypothetical protein
LYQQRADPTVGAEHHHGVGTADHRGLLQAPGRHAVDDHRIGLFGAQAGGHRDETGGVGDQPVGPPAGLGQRGHPLSDDRAPSPGERPLVVVLAAAQRCSANATPVASIRTSACPAEIRGTFRVHSRSPSGSTTPGSSTFVITAFFAASVMRSTKS